MARALVLVDVQRARLDGDPPVPDARDLLPRLQRLLDTARAKRVTVVHVQHDGEAGDADEPGTPGWELALPPAEGETVVRATSASPFQENPGLDDGLRAAGCTRLVIAGMPSQSGVRATALAALDLGFDVDLASGAHAAFADHQSAEVIASAVEKELATEGADIVWWSGALG